MVFTSEGKRLLVFCASEAHGGCTLIYDAQSGLQRKYAADYVPFLLNFTAISPDSRHYLKIYADWTQLSLVDLEAVDSSAQTGIWHREGDSEESHYAENGIKFAGAVFSPDCSKLAVWDDNYELRLFDTERGLKTPKLKRLEDPIHFAVWSPDSKSLLMVHKNGVRGILDAATLENPGGKWTLPNSYAAPIFSPDGKWFAMGTDHTLACWNRQSIQPIGLPIWYPYALSTIQYLPTSGLIAVVSGNAVCLSRPPAPKSLLVLTSAIGTTNAMYNATGTRVVTASNSSHARVWETVTGRQVLANLVHEGAVQEAFFTPDGKTIITRSVKQAMAWDAASGKRLWITSPEQDDIISLNLSPNGKRLVMAAGMREAHRCLVRQWDIVTGKPVGAILRQPEMAFDMAYSPDSKLLAVEAGAFVHLFDTETMKDIGISLRHNALVHSIEFSADGKRILTSSEDGTAQVWNTATGQQSLLPLSHRDRVRIAIFSPDGSKIATGSNGGTIHLWDAHTGKPEGAVMEQKTQVSMLAFSPDGTILVSNNDKSVQLWDLATRQRIGPGYPQTDSVTSFAFRPDGRQLMIVNSRGTVLIPLSSEPLPAPNSLFPATQCAIWMRRDSQGQESVLLASDWLHLHNTLQIRTPTPRHH